MKKLEVFEMEQVQGGFLTEFLGGVCGLGVVVLAVATGPAGIALGTTVAVHACGLGVLSTLRF